MSNRAEEKLQAEIVTWHKNECRQGILWANDNNAVSPQQMMAKRAKGFRKGASDLNFILNDIFYAIELKIYGTSHNRIHLLEQIEFGREIEKQDGMFLFCFSLCEFKQISLGDLIIVKNDTEYWIKKIEESNNQQFKFL